MYQIRIWKKKLGGHEVLKLYFQWSKNSRSWNVRAPKYLFFIRNLNFGSKVFIRKQSIFEASEALHKVEGTKKVKTKSFHQYSLNFEVEKTWISLIGWPHKTSIKEWEFKAEKKRNVQLCFMSYGPILVWVMVSPYAKLATGSH